MDYPGTLQTSHCGKLVYKGFLLQELPAAVLDSRLQVSVENSYWRRLPEIPQIPAVLQQNTLVCICRSDLPVYVCLCWTDCRACVRCFFVSWSCVSLSTQIWSWPSTRWSLSSTRLQITAPPWATPSSRVCFPSSCLPWPRWDLTDHIREGWGSCTAATAGVSFLSCNTTVTMVSLLLSCCRLRRARLGLTASCSRWMFKAARTSPSTTSGPWSIIKLSSSLGPCTSRKISSVAACCSETLPPRWEHHSRSDMCEADGMWRGQNGRRLGSWKQEVESSGQIHPRPPQPLTAKLWLAWSNCNCNCNFYCLNKMSNTPRGTNSVLPTPPRPPSYRG